MGNGECDDYIVLDTELKDVLTEMATKRKNGETLYVLPAGGVLELDAWDFTEESDVNAPNNCKLFVPRRVVEVET